MNHKGFTLVEVLTVIIIMAVLATLAIPMYDKAVERSHVAEAQAVLKQMQESKMRLLDSMGKTSFTEGEDETPLFGIRQLDMNMKCRNDVAGLNAWECQTKDFRYTLLPIYVAGSSLPRTVGVLTEGGASIAADSDDAKPYFQLAVCAARCGGDYHNTSFLYLGNASRNY